MTKERGRKKSSDWLDKTEFWRAFAPKLIKSFKKISENYKASNDENAYLREFWSDEVKIIFDTQQQVNAIKNHLKDINTTIDYLKFKGLRSFLMKNNVDEIEHLKFSYENHLVRVSSTPDICAKLGDIIYQPGISINRFNWYKFVTHKKTANLPCSKVLNQLVDKIDHIRDERHKVIHFGGHENELIKSIDSYTFDKEFLDRDQLLIEYFRKEKKKGLKRLQHNMTTNYKNCLSFTVSFLNTTADDIRQLKV